MKKRTHALTWFTLCSIVTLIVSTVAVMPLPTSAARILINGSEISRSRIGMGIESVFNSLQSRGYTLTISSADEQPTPAPVPTPAPMPAGQDSFFVSLNFDDGHAHSCCINFLPTP